MQLLNEHVALFRPSGRACETHRYQFKNMSLVGVNQRQGRVRCLSDLQSRFMLDTFRTAGALVFVASGPTHLPHRWC